MLAAQARGESISGYDAFVWVLFGVVVIAVIVVGLLTIWGLVKSTRDDEG